nr:hypothetical protein [uncultured Nitrososphaera sp.]
MGVSAAAGAKRYEINLRVVIDSYIPITTEFTDAFKAGLAHTMKKSGAIEVVDIAASHRVISK